MAIPFDEKPGGDISVKRNDTTGKFDIVFDVDQDLQMTDDMSHQVLAAVFEKKGMWWADKTRSRGSLVYTLKEDRAGTPSQLESYVSDGLQRLVAAGDIRELQVSAARVKPGRVDVSINYRIPTGRVVTLRAAVSY